MMKYSDDSGSCVALFQENAKVYEIVSFDTVAYACLGKCLALRYEMCHMLFHM